MNVKRIAVDLVSVIALIIAGTCVVGAMNGYSVTLRYRGDASMLMFLWEGIYRSLIYAGLWTAVGFAPRAYKWHALVVALGITVMIVS